MIANNKVLAVIPARGGSKGLPKKNIKKLNGKELIGWTIEAAKKCKYIDKVIVSTDCNEIAEVSKKFEGEVPYLRPAEISGDNAKTCDVVDYVLKNVDENYDILILLQPTSPFRNFEHIEKALELFCNDNASSVVSVCETLKSPYWTFWIDEHHKMQPILNDKFSDERRQDLKVAHHLNGAIYIQRVEHFLSAKKFIYEDSLAYQMDRKSSIDIDDIIDFKFAEIMVDVI